jgi:hypothetical protein
MLNIIRTERDRLLLILGACMGIPVGMVLLVLVEVIAR